MGINRTAKTWGSEIATSADMNAEVRNLWDGLQASWDTYTPTWTSTGATQPVVGNATRSGRYIQIGKTLHYRIAYQFGSTSTFGTGLYLFSLPFTAAWADESPCGQVVVVDASTSNVYGFTAALTSSATKVRIFGNNNENVGPNTPITFSTNDRITISGTVELA